MMLLPLAATAFSTAIILLLCLGDPKRRRSARMTGEGQGTAIRRVLAGAALLPGLFYAVSGSGAAFLIWLGGCGVAGWLVTLLLSPAQSGETQRR
ncbi:hypothetical protein BV96_02358 [Sphingomonas paucimobilis]|nr:hypothetical protein BV96_02358 [Sphingomonas paucimobilis]